MGGFFANVKEDIVSLSVRTEADGTVRVCPCERSRRTYCCFAWHPISPIWMRHLLSELKVDFAEEKGNAARCRVKTEAGSEHGDKERLLCNVRRGISALLGVREEKRPERVLDCSHLSRNTTSEVKRHSSERDQQVKLGGNLITGGMEWNRGWAGASPLPYGIGWERLGWPRSHQSLPGKDKQWTPAGRPGVWPVFLPTDSL
uniref:Uncharacterized protein n=1 Tax=Branchiostoma floridae TaxID=7739 RepID=C3YEV4_BRAFL|eukprot:XP_002605188.1 hypothetical protein BRAFLDRAFT_80870 [Branchiostoma floridae]